MPQPQSRAWLIVKYGKAGRRVDPHVREGKRKLKVVDLSLCGVFVSSNRFLVDSQSMLAHGKITFS
jgi:hypothetical protein